MRSTTMIRSLAATTGLMALLASTSAGAYLPDREWGTYLSGEYVSLTTDSAGDIYVCSSEEDDVILYRLGPDGSLRWFTFLGGGQWIDNCRDLAVDSVGNVIVVGDTGSDFGIATAGALQPARAGKLDGFILVVDPDGKPVWGTYIGGPEDDTIHSITVDSNDDIYVAGTVGPLSLPLPGGHDASHNGATDAVLLKISADHDLLWGTYYGGTGVEWVPGVAVSGDIVYLAGTTLSATGIATPDAYDKTLGDPAGDAFLARFDGDGVRQWATYFGGEADDWGSSVGVMPDGGAALFGQTRSLTGIATPGAFQVQNGGMIPHVDGMVARFDGGGTVKWATYFGASQNELVGGGVVDPAGNLLLVVTTLENLNLATPDAYKPMGEAFQVADLVVVKFDPSGKRRWATYVGGDSKEVAGFVHANRPLAVAGLDTVYVAGSTSSEFGILAGDPPPGPHGLGAFITKLTQGQGNPCADDSACEAGFCVDGVCCDGPCRDGTCTEGVCLVESDESTGGESTIGETGEMSEGTDGTSAATTDMTGASTSTNATDGSGTASTDPLTSSTGGETGDDPGAPTSTAGQDLDSSGDEITNSSTTDPGGDTTSDGGCSCKARTPAPEALLVALGLFVRRRRRNR